MRKLATLALVLLSAVAEAQHPRAVFDASLIARVQAKAAVADAAWVTMRGSGSGPGAACDFVTRTTTGTPDSLPPVYAAREPVTILPPGTVTIGYQGEDFYLTFMNLATCYQGLKDSDPVQAAKYTAQAVKILQKASAPFASIAPASPPSTWGTVASRMAAYVSNEGPGGQVRAVLYAHGLTTGATVTVSGVTGCTTANTTGKVGLTTGNYFDLNDTGGSPIICNGVGTNYNYNIMNDSGYGVRNFGPLLALGYDWFFGSLSAGDKTQIFASINAILDEAIRWSYNALQPGAGWDAATHTNYHAGYFTALALGGICTRGGGENARGQEWYDYWHDTLWAVVDKPFYDKWLQNNASGPDAVQYLRAIISSSALVAWAQYTANGENLFGSGGDWPWVLENMKWFVHSTMPPRTYFAQRGLIYNNADGNPPNPWALQAIGMWPIHHLADVAGDPFRPKFKRYIDDLSALNNPSSSFWKVIFYDDALSSADWTTEPLSTVVLSNPTGGYGRALMRSDWTTGAVFADLLGGPYTEGWGGRNMYDKGTMLIQRGATHLLVTPFTEVVLANNDAAWGYFSSNPRIVHANWYVTKVGDTIPIRPLSGGGNDPAYDRPFAAVPKVSAGAPQRIDRFDGQVPYVYARSVRMDENYHWSSSGWRPTVGWDREVIYLRPKVFVIYDRTNKLDKATAPTETFTQKMTFNVGKTPVTSAYATGFRSEVSHAGTFKGGLTFLLPASMAQPAVTDLGGFGLVHQISFAPPIETQYVNWLTVADAADATGNLAGVALFATRNNVDVLRVGTDTVIGFTSQQSGAAAAYPLTYTMSGMDAGVTHYLCGLSTSTTYKRTVAGNDVTIATSGGGTDTVSTAAGCITFTSGSVANPPVVVTTSDPMSGGTVGVAYSQCLSASGGDGGPYTYALDSGSVPAGTSLSAGCVTGTPTTNATYNFAVTANDGEDTSAPKNLSIIIAGNPPNITTTFLPNGTQGGQYAAQICATGGTPPYAFTKPSGSYCAGLSLVDASPCASLSGTTSAAEVCSFTIRATDSLSQTDDQALTIQVSPALLTPLSVHVLVGSTSALVIFGGAGLEANTSCVVQILQSDIVVKQNEETLRFAKQRSAFNGLSPEITYGANVSCPNSTSPGIEFFTTLPLEASAPVTVPLVLKPSPVLPTATQVTVDYGVNSVSEQTVTQACGSGCTVNLSLSSGIYVYRWIWKTAGGVALATSNTRELIVP
jgi:hypothetical protein